MDKLAVMCCAKLFSFRYKKIFPSCFALPRAASSAAPLIMHARVTVSGRTKPYPSDSQSFILAWLHKSFHNKTGPDTLQSRITD